MFTIGREREKKHAERFVAKPADVALIHATIDAVHNVLEGSISADAAIPILSNSFLTGGAGGWEQTGSWIRKLTSEHHVVAGIWAPMARHASARIRFRVAAFLDGMLPPVRAELLPLLLNDPSAKVRAKVAGDCGVEPNRNDLVFLVARRSQEKDSLVLDSLDYAINAINNMAA